MAKTKLTKGELKKQRDALKAYERYLPTLQLKKQQLQLEISHLSVHLEGLRNKRIEKTAGIEKWAGLLVEAPVNMKEWVRPSKIIVDERNIAGVDIPVYKESEFQPVQYDLFSTPFWVDAAIDLLKELRRLLEEIKVVENSIRILRQELRITNQRVNLFEKVKIPEAEEAIRVIKIYIGDQMANAVGRSKIAKRKIEGMIMEGITV